MGMYDYIGDSGDQVKCFFVPCISIDKKSEIPQVCLHAMGGLLRGFDEVPYNTPYYNYGKDFFIVEFQLEEVPYIHVIRDARYQETLIVSQMDDDYWLPPVAIDNYGVRLNIHTTKELKEFVEDYCDKKDLAYVMEVQYLNEYGLSYKLDFEKMRGLSAEELQSECKIRDMVARKVYDKTMKLFNDKWFFVEDADLINFGLVIADYIELEINKNPDRVPRTTEDWQIIFEASLKKLKIRFEHPLDAYLDWCNQQGIQLDRDLVFDVTKQYAQKML